MSIVSHVPYRRRATANASHVMDRHIALLTPACKELTIGAGTLDAHKALGASVVARGGGDANAAWRLKHVAQHHALAVSSREARHRQNAGGAADWGDVVRARLEAGVHLSGARLACSAERALLQPPSGDATIRARCCESSPVLVKTNSGDGLAGGRCRQGSWIPRVCRRMVLPKVGQGSALAELPEVHHPRDVPREQQGPARVGGESCGHDIWRVRVAHAQIGNR
mmetsp:Transcript_40852/g.78025  ORF Transcript_40852/g.78025 Transcript_40852/m.78025 type:complete len:225 (-) Transcript_40852:59-733(-)